MLARTASSPITANLWEADATPRTAREGPLSPNDDETKSRRARGGRVSFNAGRNPSFMGVICQSFGAGNIQNAEFLQNRHWPAQAAVPRFQTVTGQRWETQSLRFRAMPREDLMIKRLQPFSTRPARGAPHVLTIARNVFATRN
jgi:hypothetical protein